MQYQPLDTAWVLIGAVLVFAMQAGFALVEAGFSRQKNAANAVIKNITDFLISSLVFCIIGFRIMYAGVAEGSYAAGIPDKVFIFYELVFCGTAATIASGAFSGRMRFSSYCLYSLVMSAVIYPVSGHWAWGGGFLQKMGYHDFAGGSVVHMVGGISALVGAMILGPRIGKYNEKHYSNAIQGHSMTQVALGVFVLWIGWFGFNGSSTMGISTEEQILTAGNVLLNTALAGAAAGITTLLVSWFRYHRADISMVLNGVLGGLVAITSGCDVMDQGGAIATGVIASLVMIASIEIIDITCHIDDPVGASSVHGICGIVGILLTGVFSTKNGLLHAGGFRQLGIQCIGVLVMCAWVTGCMLVFMLILKALGILRVSKDAEMIGLDRSEHGYVGDMLPRAADFATDLDKDEIRKMMGEVEDRHYISDHKVRSVVIITRENKLNDLKNALNDIGISGITVSDVMGCGVQKGHIESFYRGVEMEVELLPKVRVEVVISEVPLNSVIEAAKKVLKTGNTGDGKIFVYGVENVIRIRTEEEGEKAL